MNYYQELAEDLSVPAEWTVIPVKPPVKVEKQIQEVLLVVSDARVNTGRKFGVAFLPDGTKIEPELEIADENGQWYRLGAGGSFSVTDYDRDTETMAATSIGYKLEELPKGTRFESLRIRSSTPFTCKKIRWHTYYMK